MAVKRQQAVEQRAANHLVHRVVASDVLADDQQRPAGVEQPGGMQSAGALEGGLAQALGEVGEELAGEDRTIRQRRGVHGHVLCVSGRLCFELVQKAAVAGTPVLVGVGAPSSLAIRLAAERGMTLCGFARGESVNVYTGAERVAGAVGAAAG